MTTERTLELARGDYGSEESRREILFSRLQFLLTATTLLIAANLSLMAQTPSGWRWWTLAVPTAVVWLLLMRLFHLVWRMYSGHDSLQPKSMKSYLEWKAKRTAELESMGYADADVISVGEMEQLLIEDYSVAATSNREINLEVQATMVQAQRTVLWLTLTQTG